MLIRRMLGRCAALAVAAVVAGPVIAAAPADAATSTVHGQVVSAVQDRTGATTVTGWAYDAARPSVSIGICVWSNGRCQKSATAAVTDQPVDTAHHITGRHGFKVVLARAATGATVNLRAATVSLSTLTVSTPGARIVAVARKYVGKARYVEDGASPAKGFDCSGYTLYAYAQAHVATLPHNADQQRRAAGMRRITKATARPGDLVFYFSGSYAYHVAIYAGGGMQYAAATPKDGIRYQIVWSSAVGYYTDWH
jgi:cell wall-associated NlpC family hydrolase